MLESDGEWSAGYLLGMGTQDFTEEERESLEWGRGRISAAEWDGRREASAGLGQGEALYFGVHVLAQRAQRDLARGRRRTKIW